MFQCSLAWSTTSATVDGVGIWGCSCFFCRLPFSYLAQCFFPIRSWSVHFLESLREWCCATALLAVGPWWPVISVPLRPHALRAQAHSLEATDFAFVIKCPRANKLRFYLSGYTLVLTPSFSAFASVDDCCQTAMLHAQWFPQLLRSVSPHRSMNYTTV